MTAQQPTTSDAPHPAGQSAVSGQPATSPASTSGGTTAICLVTPRDGAADDVLRLVLPLVEPSRGEPGNLGYDWYQEADGVLVLVEQWTDRAAFDVHCARPRVVEVFQKELLEFLEQEPEVHLTTHLTPRS